jgi:hypothetical protein
LARDAQRFLRGTEGGRVRIVVGPWTQTLSVEWRTELQFYEERIPMLRELEDEGSLKAFYVGDDYVAARLLGGGNHQMTVRKDGLSLDILGKDADTQAVLDIALRAMQRVGSSRTRDTTARLSHLVQLDIPFDQAVSRSLGCLATPSGAQVSSVDYAMLLDLVAPDDVFGQVEFGIVRGAEARARLSGIGQRLGRASRAVREHNWENVEVPEVGLFADSAWQMPGSWNAGVEWEGLFRFWAAVTEYAGQFVEGLQQRITANC